MASPAHALNHEIIDDLMVILGEGFNEIIKEQVAQAHVYLRELQPLLDADDAESAMRRAHAFKSSAGQIGLQGIHALAQNLESTCKADMGTGAVSPQARDLYRAITAEFPEAVRLLLRYTQGF